MSAKTVNLISITQVVDHDCGNYQIGELDFAFSGLVQKYLEENGYEGKKSLLAMLGHMSYMVTDSFNRLPTANMASASSKEP